MIGDIMAAKVSINSASIGNGKSYGWRSILSPRPLSPDETSVKINFGIKNVPGNADEAYETVAEAFRRLQQNGDIVSYQVGLTGAVPEVICNPGSEVVDQIRKSKKVENEFVVSLQGKLQKLLDKIAKKKR